MSDTEKKLSKLSSNLHTDTHTHFKPYLMCKQVHMYVRVRESVLTVKAWQQAPLPLGHLTDSKTY